MSGFIAVIVCPSGLSADYSVVVEMKEASELAISYFRFAGLLVKSIGN